MIDDRKIRFRSAPDGLAVGKMRGFHIASSSFWQNHGFGYKKTGSGEGHW